MKNIYDADVVREIDQRLDTLRPDTQRLWGTMDVAQMMAHCSAAIEISLGDRKGESSLMGKLIGPFFKSVITSDKPFKQSLPTDKNFVITDQRDFDKEKTRLRTLVHRFSKSEAQMTNKRHLFFGKMTAKEWSTSTYKHLDHHFRQFGADRKSVV